MVWLAVLIGAGAWRITTRGDQDAPVHPEAPAPKNVKVVDGREYLWASGPRQGPESQWFDITDSPLKKEGYQYGIGKDRIRPIDHPVFVKPDDPRLLAAAGTRVRNADQIRVIGYVYGGEARAYPIELLNRHELVNDTIAKKPLTVGW